MAIMTFREYNDFDKFCENKKFQRNVSYYDPQKGWILDLDHKINNLESNPQEFNNDHTEQPTERN